MTKIYSAQHRFLTFKEADIVDRALSAHLQVLEQQGQSEGQEASLARQILRDFVYFTSADTLENLKNYLLIDGWQCALSSNKHYYIFWLEGEAFDPNKIYIKLPSSLQFSDASDLIIRAMYTLAFLEGGPENVSAYNILQRARDHAKKEKEIEESNDDKKMFF
jgi:hypothetical protein